MEIIIIIVLYLIGVIVAWELEVWRLPENQEFDEYEETFSYIISTFSWVSVFICGILYLIDFLEKEK